MKNYLRLGKARAYKIAYLLGNQIWDLVKSWSYFEKDTVGKQLARAVDSVAANLAEGFGRYHKKTRSSFSLMPENRFLNPCIGFRFPTTVNCSIEINTRICFYI